MTPLAVNVAVNTRHRQLLEESITLLPASWRALFAGHLDQDT